MVRNSKRRARPRKEKPRKRERKEPCTARYKVHIARRSLCVYFKGIKWMT